MKKITLSLIASLAMTGSLMAGGDIVPVEEVVVEVVAPSVDDSGFYLGLAYGLMDASTDVSVTNPAYPNLSYNETFVDNNFDEVMILAGYDYNKYVGIEGRYWFGLSDTLNFSDWSASVNHQDTTIDAWGIYLKPQYSWDNGVGVYALLGYAAADMTIDNLAGISGASYTSDSVDGFSWGLGAKYAYNENISVFVDYVSVYDDTAKYVDYSTDDRYEVDNSINTWNFGVAYKF